MKDYDSYEDEKEDNYETQYDDEKEDDEEENPEADEVLIYLLFSTSLINTLISIGRDSQGGNRTSR